jgi:hypothetical protein
MPQLVLPSTERALVDACAAELAAAASASGAAHRVSSSSLLLPPLRRCRAALLAVRDSSVR